jgi:hypothetical protein
LQPAEEVTADDPNKEKSEGGERIGKEYWPVFPKWPGAVKKYGERREQRPDENGDLDLPTRVLRDNLAGQKDRSLEKQKQSE